MNFRTGKCNHGQKGRCINCLTQQLKQQKKQNQANAQSKSNGCVHPPNMKCLKCIDSKSQIKQQINACKHPSYEHCSNCFKNQKQFDMSFAQYLNKLQMDCKHKKPCKKCVPPLSRKTFMVDRQCKNHLPYPQAQCDSCMPPTVTLCKQLYSHVQKVIVKTTSIYKVSQTQLFGVLVGFKKQGILYIEDVYFPKQQQKIGHYITPDSLQKYQQILSYFGYQQLGLIYSSSRINSMDLLLSSVFQNYFSSVDEKGYKYSSFITMRLNNDDINPYFECFMVSDQFQALHQHNLIFEKFKDSASFDLVTAKSQKGVNTPSLPTFLIDGIQQQEYPFDLIILWLKTEYEQNFFVINESNRYPFYCIQNQRIQNIEILMNTQSHDPVDKYRNIQFLFHLDSLLGREDTILFLNNFIFDDPEFFLKQKIDHLKTSRMNKSLDDSSMIMQEEFNY